MSKLLVATCSNTVKQWYKQLSEQRKKWTQENEALVSLTTSWVNKRQQLRTARGPSAYCDLNLLPHVAEEVEQVITSELLSLRGKIEKSFTLLTLIIADLSELGTELESQKQIFTSKVLESSSKDIAEIDAKFRESPPMTVVVIRKCLEWHHDIISMYEAELSVKRYIIAALLAPSHGKILSFLTSNLSKLSESVLYQSTPSESLINKSTYINSNVPHLAPWIIQSISSSSSASGHEDVGSGEGLTPQQLRIYLSSLSLEAYIDETKIEHIGNVVNHIIINQLVID